jgi:hypothetical protein
VHEVWAALSSAATTEEQLAEGSRRDPLAERS